MGSAGGIGSFAQGFSNSFAASRKNKTLRETLNYERQQDAEKSRREEQQFQQEMDFKERQAQALEQYRSENMRIDKEAKDKMAIVQQKQMDLNITKEFMSLADPTIPKAVRQLGFRKMVKNLGIDPNSPDAKEAIAALGTLDSEALDGIRTGLALALPQAHPGEISAMAQGVFSGKVSMTDLYKMANDAKTAKLRQEAFGSAPQMSAGGDAGGQMPTGAPALSDTPEAWRRKARDLFQAGDMEGGQKALDLAKQIQGSGTEGTMRIPPGYEQYTNPEGRQAVRPIMGSPQEAEQRAAAEKEAGRKREADTSGNIMIQDLGRSRNMLTELAKNWPTGPAAGVQIAARRRNPQDPIYQLDQTLATVRANVSMGRIQEMRANSPTGGALGNVSDKDLELLERTAGNIDVNQDPQVLLDNMNRLDNQTRDLVYGTPDQIEKFVDDGKLTEAEGYRFSRRHKLSFDEFGEPVSKGITKAEYDKLKSGDTYTDPEGNLRRKP